MDEASDVADFDAEGVGDLGDGEQPFGERRGVGFDVVEITGLLGSLVV